MLARMRSADLELRTDNGLPEFLENNLVESRNLIKCGPSRCANYSVGPLLLSAMLLFLAISYTKFQHVGVIGTVSVIICFLLSYTHAFLMCRDLCWIWILVVLFLLLLLSLVVLLISRLSANGTVLHLI